MRKLIIPAAARAGRVIDLSALKDLPEPVDLEALETKHVQEAAKDVEVLARKLRSRGKI